LASWWDKKFLIFNYFIFILIGGSVCKDFLHSAKIALLDWVKSDLILSSFVFWERALSCMYGLSLRPFTNMSWKGCKLQMKLIYLFVTWKVLLEIM